MQNLTVVVTNFGRPDFLEHCLQSIVTAGCKNIVCVSMEPSSNIVGLHHELMRKEGLNFTSVTLPHDLGNNELWLQGVYRALTDYVLILHDDDMLLPEFQPALETHLGPLLHEKSVGFASWPGRQDNGALVDFFKGPMRAAYSSTVSKAMLQPGTRSISPSMCIYRRDLAIRVLKECAEWRDPKFFLRMNMMVGNDLMLALRHAEESKPWLRVNAPLTGLGVHPESETIKSLDDPKKATALHGAYDAARAYFREHRAAAFKPQPRLLHVWSDYVPRNDDVERLADVEASWERHYATGDLLAFPVTDEQLRRTTRSELGDSRKMPFLRDLLDWGVGHAQEEDLVILSNRDVGIVLDGPGQILRLFEAPIGAAIAWRRCFNGRVNGLVRDARHGVLDNGVDLVVVRPKWWKEHREAIPDFVMGCEGWDWAFRLVVEESHARFEPAFYTFDNLIYHRRHPAFWRGQGVRTKNPGQQHNLRLMKNWFTARGDFKLAGKITEAASHGEHVVMTGGVPVRDDEGNPNSAPVSA